MRTSSLTNKDGDSKHRQKSSIMKWVKSNGYTVSGEYFDIVSGKTDTMDRSEFLRMIHDSETMNIKTLVFSDQSRLSRDIVVQEQTYRLLSSRGYKLISSENQNSFIEDTSTNHLLRQIMGSFCEFDRSSTVSKLRDSRIRKRESNRDKGIVTRNRIGKCEGRRRVLEIHEELGSLVLKLRRKGLSLRKISSLLKDEYGYKVSFVSVGNILKDIEWMKKEKRRMKRLETVN
jgi:DNA invertase Pin-like site-specific DNA recombinase